MKPVLFASGTYVEPIPMPVAPEWLAPMLEALASPSAAPYREAEAVRDLAIVIDLPSDRGTKLGVSLTEHGFRPIPLYNALSAAMAIVDMVPITRVLAGGADHVAKVSAAAPPAFLLDANRMGPGRVARAGLFDNRSVCRASDFPSSDRFLQAGIRRVLFITEALGTDLELVALEWQAAGIALWQKRPSDETNAATLLRLRRSWLGRRVWSFIYERSFRKGADGAYGAMIEESGAG